MNGAPGIAMRKTRVTTAQPRERNMTMKSHEKNGALNKVFQQPIEIDAAAEYLMMRYQICQGMLLDLDAMEEKELESSAKETGLALDDLLLQLNKQVREQMLDDKGGLDFVGTPQELAETMSQLLCERLANELEHKILEVCDLCEEPRYLVEADIAGMFVSMFEEENDRPFGEGPADNTIQFPRVNRKSNPKS